MVHIQEVEGSSPPPTIAPFMPPGDASLDPKLEERPFGGSCRCCSDADDVRVADVCGHPDTTREKSNEFLDPFCISIAISQPHTFSVHLRWIRSAFHRARRKPPVAAPIRGFHLR